MSEQVNTGIASAILAAIALPLPKRSLQKTYHFPTTSDRSFSPQHLAKRPVERSTVDSSPLLQLLQCGSLICFPLATTPLSPTNTKRPCGCTCRRTREAQPPNRALAQERMVMKDDAFISN